MILIKTETFPGTRKGWFASGKVTTNEGVGTFTYTGPDISTKIGGLSLTPMVADVTGETYIPVMNTIAYSNGVTTFTFTVKKLTHTAADDNVVAVTDVDITVYYFVWINGDSLPSNTTTNTPNPTDLQ